MSRGSSAALFIGAVLVSFAMAYFLLPILQPTPGLIRQTQIVRGATFTNRSNDDPLIYTPVANMSLLVTTTGVARLHASFDAIIITDYGSGLSTEMEWRIALVVANVGNNTAFIGYDPDVGLTSTVRFYQQLSLQYDTDPLPAATYNVTVYWASWAAVGGSHNMYIPLVTTVNYSRTLLVQEISA